MEDSGVFIYILIFVAIALKGIMDVVWKKSAKSIDAMPPIDASAIPQEPEVPVTEKRHKRRNIEKKQKEQSYEQIVTHNKSDLEGLTSYGQKEISTLNTDHTDTTNDLATINDIDDLKRAIIYSEIIGRKYT